HCASNYRKQHKEDAKAQEEEDRILSAHLVRKGAADIQCEQGLFAQPPQSSSSSFSFSIFERCCQSGRFPRPRKSRTTTSCFCSPGKQLGSRGGVAAAGPRL